MSLTLPERASHEFLRKLAKDRLAAMRAANPSERLATAQLEVALEYGFRSWRALKAEVDRRRAPALAAYVQACTTGNVQALRELLRQAPGLVREPVQNGSTGLHQAARHPEAVRLLLEYGADPNARDVGDNASPLHIAAAHGILRSVRVLLDAGADVHGPGDVHEAGIIGWASRKGNEAVVSLLLERGARHHIFSAMALGDRDLVERLVEEDPACLRQRRSRFEARHTPVHAAFIPPDGLGFLAGGPDYAMLASLIELGADVDAPDGRGRTPLGMARLRGDREAIRLLTEAGAVEPEPLPATSDTGGPAALATSVQKGDPMFRVRDMRDTVRWYEALGFTIVDQHEDGGDLIFAKLSFGSCEFGLSPGATTGPRDVSLWFHTDRVEDLYQRFRERQPALERADVPHGSLAIRFEEDLYTPFYGGRQFSLRDPNGLSLIFWQPDRLAPGSEA